METFVACQLRPLLTRPSPHMRQFYLRDTSGEHEVDLVLQTADGRLVGIEVKAGGAVSGRDARHLAWLRDRLGGQFHRGLVLHSGEMTYPLGEKLWAMPICSLWTPSAWDQP